MKNALVLVAAAAFAMHAASAETPDIAGAVRIAPGFEDVYSDSKKKEAKAQKEIARIDAEVDASETLRLQGERLVADSDAEIAAHRSAYRAFGARFGAAQNAVEADGEAAALAGIAKAWAASEANRARGEKMIAQSEKDAARAEARRADAERKIAEARDAMARSTLGFPVASAPELLAPAAPEAVAPLAPVASEPLAPAIDATPAAAPSGLDVELLGGPADAAAGEH